SKLKTRGAYYTGPLARFCLNYEKLTPAAKDAAQAAGLNVDCRNPFRSIIARAVETLYACEEALRIIEGYEMPDHDAVNVTPADATGCGCTEAPRGILYHRYRINAQGIIQEAKIVPPTSQNLKRIEEDLSRFIPPRVNLPEEQLTHLCEQAVRNYDPCISCATHFLKLKLERE
ncbi:MAG TPA: nickel-dependent hydrogenase large subunit, partial [Acidobacteriota bacterium]|nr:nickel-dependent hydrogenase large subunit [Acidobacteriota bacterium]